MKRAALGALVFCVPLSGCQQIAALWTVMSGGDTTPAEFKLAPRPVAVVVDNPDEFDVAPEATRELHESVARQLEAHKVKCQFVSFSESQRLRAGEPRYDDLSIRQIGEKLGADQVLYLRVKYWATRENPGDPHFKGSAKLGVKVISTERKHDVRLWPTDGSDKTVEAETDPMLSDAAGAEVQVSRQLASKLADAVAKCFYDHKPHED